MKRAFNFILLLALLSCQPMADKSKPAKTEKLNLEEITISQLQQGYRDGKFTISEVVKAYLGRIDAIDKHGPQLNSIIVVNPDALQIAAVKFDHGLGPAGLGFAPAAGDGGLSMVGVFPAVDV